MAFRDRGIEIKSRDQIDLMRPAGLLTGQALELLRTRESHMPVIALSGRRPPDFVLGVTAWLVKVTPRKASSMRGTPKSSFFAVPSS